MKVAALTSAIFRIETNVNKCGRIKRMLRVRMPRASLDRAV